MRRIGALFGSAEDAEAAIHLLRDQLGLDDSSMSSGRLGAAGTTQDGLPLLGVRVPPELGERAADLLRMARGELVDVTATEVQGEP